MNYLILFIVILAGIYVIYIIRRQVKTGKCAYCPEKKTCQAGKPWSCPETNKKKNE